MMLLSPISSSFLACRAAAAHMYCYCLFPAPGTLSEGAFFVTCNFAVAGPTFFPGCPYAPDVTFVGGMLTVFNNLTLELVSDSALPETILCFVCFIIFYYSIAQQSPLEVTATMTKARQKKIIYSILFLR